MHAFSLSRLSFGDGQSCVFPNGAASDSPLHFTGQPRDPETGLDYFGARYNNSSLGRFLTPDWSAQAEPVPYAKLDNPQSLNLYTYAGNNPVSRVDTDGHCDNSDDGHTSVVCNKNGTAAVTTSSTRVGKFQFEKQADGTQHLVRTDTETTTAVTVDSKTGKQIGEGTQTTTVVKHDYTAEAQHQSGAEQTLSTSTRAVGASEEAAIFGGQHRVDSLLRQAGPGFGENLRNHPGQVVTGLTEIGIGVGSCLEGCEAIGIAESGLGILGGVNDLQQAFDPEDQP